MKTVRRYTWVLAALLIVACEEGKKDQAKKEVKSIMVKTATLKKETIKEVRTYFGTLNFSKSTRFIAQQPGVITKLNAVPGQKVSRGQLIAMYPPMHHQLQIAQAKIQQEKTNQDYRRQLELYHVGAVSKVSVEDIKAQLDMEEKVLQQLQSVNIIRAPFSGIITQVYAKIGQEVGIEMPIFGMAKTGNIEVTFYVSPKEVSKIKLGASVYFTKNAKKIIGKVTKKAIQMEAQRRAYLVTASFDNAEILFVGETIDIMVETGVSTDNIWIPVDAFRKQGSGFYVYVLEEDKAKRKKIAIGKRNEQSVQVLSGLKSNDKLIIAGIDKLKDNTAVRTSL